MTRPTRYALFAVLAVIAGAGAYGLGVLLRPAPEPAGTELQNPVAIDGLQLVDGAGEPVDLAADFSGELTLVFFGYTRCPDVCPLTLAQLARVYEGAGEPDDVNVVMVTVDPDFDTPEVVGGYVRRFHPDFVGLTGSNQQVATAAKAFFIGYSGAASQQQLVHTDVVAVVDREGMLRRIYGTADVPQLANDLPNLRRRL